jgi:hypothetical protein
MVYPLSRPALVLLTMTHVVLGLAVSNFPLVAKVFGWLPTLVILTLVVFNRNRNNEAFFGSMYIIGSEVIWRMTGGYVTYEFAKYSVALILVVGKVVEQKQIPFNRSTILYVISFLPATVISLNSLPSPQLFSQLSSILSGAICLTAAVIYFTGRIVSAPVFFKALQTFGFTLVTLLLVLYIKTPDLESIEYTAESNFTTSGGFGPNQVSTVIGFGLVIMVILVWSGRRLTGFLLTDGLFSAALLFRGLLTFSRGGILAALLSLAAFVLIMAIRKQNSFQSNLRIIFLLAAGFSIVYIIWARVSTITQGQIVNRYTGKDTHGHATRNVSSGRFALNEDELLTFYESPILGAGIANSKFIRLERLNLFVNTHNEFTRIPAEQGIIGIAGFIMLLVTLRKHYNRRSQFAKGTLYAFTVFFIVTLTHSALRMSLAGMTFGLALIMLPTGTAVFSRPRRLTTRIHHPISSSAHAGTTQT